MLNTRHLRDSLELCEFSCNRMEHPLLLYIELYLYLYLSVYILAEIAQGRAAYLAFASLNKRGPEIWLRCAKMLCGTIFALFVLDLS